MSRRHHSESAIRIDLWLEGKEAQALRDQAERSGSGMSSLVRQAIRIAFLRENPDPDQPLASPTPDPDHLSVTDPDHPQPSDPDQSDPDRVQVLQPPTERDPDQLSDEDLASLFN